MNVARRLSAVLLFCAAACAHAMEISKVWTTGRWPVETTPLLTDLDGDGANEILAVNRGGELLHWRLDGTPIGAGSDGIAGKLPEGQWTSTPTLVEAAGGPLIVVCNTKGLVLALGTNLKERWRHELGGATVWGRAVPGVVTEKQKPIFAFMTEGGVFTALDAAGNVAWTARSDIGVGGPSAGAVRLRDGSMRLLAPLGTGLACFSPDGRKLWETPLPASQDPAKGAHPAGPPAPVVRSTPRVLALRDRDVIVCLADGGIVAALNTEGQMLWTREVSGEFDNSVAFYERPDGSALILFTELFGNLHAVTPEGQPVWTHAFRSKNRGTPRIIDTDGDGDAEIVVATYAQHVLAFDEDGRLVDDVRVSGLANPTLVPLPGARAGRDDLFLTTASLLAYRLSSARPKSPYASGDGGAISLGWERTADAPVPQLLVENPAGRFIVVNTTIETSGGQRTVTGAVTSRSLFQVPIPPAAVETFPQARTEVRDAGGTLLARLEADLAAVPVSAPPPADRGLWSANPYEPFAYGSHSVQSGDVVAVDGLYVGEADQGAFIVRARERAEDVRIEMQPLERNDGAAFGGAVNLFRVVPVPTMNGVRPVEIGTAPNREMVPDALVPLGPANVVALATGEAAKVWVRVDAHGAEPGVYKGRITATPLSGATRPQELTLRIEVLPLRMPKRFPLTLCTWDFVPNKWFPRHTDTVLDDMQRHGVDVFPRILPKSKASLDGAIEFEQCEINKFRADLERLKGRGQLLLMMPHPAVQFPWPPEPEMKRRCEIAYLQRSRDEVMARGWNYDDFALYPVDEPGLNYQTENVDALARFAQLAREADPRFRLYTDPVPTISLEGFDRIDPLMDVWCPNMRMVTGLLAKDPRMERIMDSGKPVWSYECVSQVKSLSPLRYNRANAWRAYAFGLDGIGFWTHSQTQKDMWYPSDEEYALVYPGELPVPSVRWESVRDGLEDVAAMELLKEAIAKHKVLGTMPNAVGRAEEELRIAQNDILQLSDAAFVESRDYLDKGDRLIWHSVADIETYRRHRAAIAKLTMELEGKG